VHDIVGFADARNEPSPETIQPISSREAANTVVFTLGGMERLSVKVGRRLGTPQPETGAADLGFYDFPNFTRQKKKSYCCKLKLLDLRHTLPAPFSFRYTPATAKRREQTHTIQTKRQEQWDRCLCFLYVLFVSDLLQSSILAI